METYLKKLPYYEIKPCPICNKYCDDSVFVNRKQYCRKCLDKTWKLFDAHLETKMKDTIVDNIITNHKEIIKLVSMFNL